MSVLRTRRFIGAGGRRAALVASAGGFAAAILFVYLAAPSKMNDVSSPYSGSSVTERRARLYEKMAHDLSEHGAAFLAGGETSQSLSLSDLFRIEDGRVQPNLRAANPPVRANVLYLEPRFANPISNVVKETFLPYFDGVIWFQNTQIYHFSMFHASHHLTPVQATESEIQAEASAIKGVAGASCPLNILLDRVVLTSTGVLLGLWKVVSGTDPVDIREKLREALPQAPEKQLYDPVLLHTSFARLLGPPKLSQQKSTTDQLKFFQELVTEVNKKLAGFQATVSELWFVQEHDVLALALDGRMTTQKFHLSCRGQEQISPEH